MHGDMDVDAGATPPHPATQAPRPDTRGPRPPPPPVPQSVPSASESQVRRRPTAAMARVEALRCRMCPVPATAHLARDGRGLVQHLVTMRMGEPLTLEAIRQLRGLDSMPHVRPHPSASHGLLRTLWMQHRVPAPHPRGRRPRPQTGSPTSSCR